MKFVEANTKMLSRPFQHGNVRYSRAIEYILQHPSHSQQPLIPLTTNEDGDSDLDSNADGDKDGDTGAFEDASDPRDSSVFRAGMPGAMSAAEVETNIDLNMWPVKVGDQYAVMEVRRRRVPPSP